LPPPPPSTLFPYTTLFRSVVDQEHAGWAARPRQGGIGLGADGLARDRKGERERGAASGLAVHTDVATVSPDDRVHHRQAQPRSADRKSTRLNSSHGSISYA